MSDSIQMPSQVPALPATNTDLYYQREVDFKRQADISLTTFQGDKITISNSYEKMQSLEYEGHFTSFGQSQSLASSSMTIGSYSLTIEGDLNEEELADIKDLLKDLSKIGRSFFRGNMEKAMGKALNIGDTGTINQFSASFSYNYIETTSLIENHTLPSLAQNEEAFPGLNEFLHDEVEERPSYRDILQGQMEQIHEVLEDSKEDIVQKMHHNDDDNFYDDVASTADKMMGRMKETLTDHPRLSPIALPMTNRIIEHIADEEPRYHGKGELVKNLRHHFHRAFNRWLDTV